MPNNVQTILTKSEKNREGEKERNPHNTLSKKETTKAKQWTGDCSPRKAIELCQPKIQDEPFRLYISLELNTSFSQ
jgi:hypothetical protein